MLMAASKAPYGVGCNCEAGIFICCCCALLTSEAAAAAAALEPFAISGALKSSKVNCAKATTVRQPASQMGWNIKKIKEAALTEEWKMMLLLLLMMSHLIAAQFMYVVCLCYVKLCYVMLCYLVCCFVLCPWPSLWMWLFSLILWGGELVRGVWFQAKASNFTC